MRNRQIQKRIDRFLKESQRLLGNGTCMLFALEYHNVSHCWLSSRCTVQRLYIFKRDNSTPLRYYLCIALHCNPIVVFSLLQEIKIWKSWLKSCCRLSHWLMVSWRQSAGIEVEADR